MRAFVLRSLLAAATLLGTPLVSHARGAFRWGPVGHRVIAQIAMDRLTPAAAAETRRLLDGQDIPDVASWADEQRGTLGPRYSPWHYVDIEIGDSSYVAARDCKADACVIASLDKEMAILGDRKQSDSARGFALKWIVHLVGDLHQPLHGGERADKGGNDVKVTYNGRITNLHSLWDSGLLTAWGESDQQIEDTLRSMIARRTDVQTLAGGTDVQWVMESHDISRDFVYGKLPQSLVIDSAYAAAAKPIILDRMMRAGIRLAAVLNRELK